MYGMEVHSVIFLIDICVAVYICAGLIYGYVRGIIGETIKIAALGAGGYAAFYLKNYFAVYFVDRYHLPYLLANVAGFLVLFGLVIVLTPLIHIILKKIFIGDRSISFIERFLGLIFGGAKNTLIIVILTAILLIIPGLENKLSSSIVVQVYDTLFKSFVEDYLGRENPLIISKRIPELMKNPEFIDKLSSSPVIKEIISDPHIDSLRGDENIKELWRSNNYQAIFKNEKINQLMKDPDMQNKLKKLSKEIVRIDDEMKESP